MLQWVRLCPAPLSPCLQICPDFCSSLMSLLWLKRKAKQPTLLYISQPVPADMCSLKHFWARDTSLVCSVLLQKKREKNASLFFFLLLGRVTFFDVSTESLVLQHLLPDALIESPMSNRKRNKCFIELELSLVMVGWRDGKTEKKGWGGFYVNVISLGKCYSQPSVKALFLDVAWIISVPGLDSLTNGHISLRRIGKGKP